MGGEAVEVGRLPDSTVLAASQARRDYPASRTFRLRAKFRKEVEEEGGVFHGSSYCG